jgi:hypothetical protein
MAYIGTNDFALEVAAGNVSDTLPLNKYGLNGDVDTAASEYLWSAGGSFVLPTTARLHDLVSDNAADDGAPVGTGAHIIEVFGLDASYNLQSEEVTLNGTSNVATANTYTMIHRLRVKEAGSTNSNVGTITATAQTDATVTAQIEPTVGSTQMAIYVVPNGYTFYMTQFYLTIDKSSGGAASLEVEVVQIMNVDQTTDSEIVRHDEKAHSTNNPSISHSFAPYKSFSEKSLVFIRVTTDTNNVEVSGGFDGYLKLN